MAARTRTSGVEGKFETGYAPALRLDSGVGCDRRNSASQADVAVGDTPRVMTAEPYVDVAVAQVEVGMVVQCFGCGTDGVDDREPCGEVGGPDPGLQATEQVDPPVQRLVRDLLCTERGHEVMLAYRMEVWIVGRPDIILSADRIGRRSFSRALPYGLACC
jgi:hypothetical protein